MTKSKNKSNHRISIHYLSEIWQFYRELRSYGTSSKPVEWKYINGVFNALGIGTEPTITYLMHEQPEYEEFEDWIFNNGAVSEDIISFFNAVVSGSQTLQDHHADPVLTNADLDHFDRYGYVIISGAVSEQDCRETVNLICDKIGADLSKPETWYAPSELKQGIMIQLFNDPILNKNRLSFRIRNAYQQLWNRKDLMVSMDRVSFNPPETNHYRFPGPNLHWDVSLKQPIPFGLQGLLYLNDVDENQGAFTVIPGFHKSIESWLNELNPADDPRDSNLLEGFERKAITANEGDFIIWHQCLPHGSCPNRSEKPRIVQYINYQPLDLEYQNEWI